MPCTSQGALECVLLPQSVSGGLSSIQLIARFMPCNCQFSAYAAAAMLSNVACYSVGFSSALPAAVIRH